jgi:hypothetical protein
MYGRKAPETGYLFADLFPFGGKLNPDNRWLKLAELIKYCGFAIARDWVTVTYVLLSPVFRS